MLKVKVSTKRQVTFPRKVCESLGIQSGDEILLDRHVEGDEEVWYLKLGKGKSRPWLGALKGYAGNKDHNMKAVRESIAKGRTFGES